MENFTLYAEQNIYGWSVIDPEGGRWWPHEEAQSEITASEDPATTAIEVCMTQVMRGDWHN